MKKYGNAEHLTLQALRYGSESHAGCATAHGIARVTGYTPQHINTCLKRLFAKGVVAYRVKPHRGTQYKREWATVKVAKKQPSQWIIPEYEQMEMSI